MKGSDKNIAGNTFSKKEKEYNHMVGNLIAFCLKYITLSDLEKEQIFSTFKPIQLKRKDYLLTEGKVCDFVAFLNAGIIRHFHIKDGNEITCDITLPQNFITDFKSLTQNILL